MTASPPPATQAMIDRLQTIRTGRAARQRLAASFALAPPVKKVLRLQLVERLDAAARQEAGEDHAESSHTASSPHQVVGGAWFDEFLDDLVQKFIARLGNLVGTAAVESPFFMQVRAAHAGRLAENDFAAALWDGLRRPVPKFANLLQADRGESDLVQTVTVRLLDWFVADFAGTTDAELWSAAKRTLAHAAIDEGKRPDRFQEASEPDGDADPGQSASAVVANREQGDRLARLLDGLHEADRLLFRLHYLQSKTYPELAELLGHGTTADEVGQRVRAIKDRLRRLNDS